MILQSVVSSGFFLVGVLGLDLELGEKIDFPLTDKEHKIAAGFYSESGRYRGGVPKRSSEVEKYICNEYALDSTNSTAIACVDWSVNEFGGGETETGSCVCGSFNERFCEGYSCFTLEEETKATCTKTGTYTKSCVYASEVELTTCGCVAESDNGLYCKSWECEEIDKDAHEEHEEYECRVEAESGEFCQAWTGQIWSKEEFEQTTCSCDAQWEGDAVCSVWECVEREYGMCAQARWKNGKGAKKGWCNFDLAVGVGGTIGAIGFIATGVLVFLTFTGEMSAGDTCLAFLGSVGWACLWSVGVVIWGGVFAVEAVAIYWSVPILLGLFFGGLFRLYRCAEEGPAPTPAVGAGAGADEEAMGKQFSA